MSIRHRAIGLANVAISVLFCPLLLMAWGCSTKEPPPYTPDTPTDVNATLSFEYIRQGTLEAFPLGVPHVDSSFDTARTDLEVVASDSTPGLAWIEENDLVMYDYMLEHTMRSQPDLPEYSKHLFAIHAFSYPGNDSINLGRAGRTLEIESDEFNCTEVVSFVCVAVIRYVFSDCDADEAVSGTTVHELGHLTNPNATTGIKDCGYGATHAGKCAMMDMTKTGGVLEVCCNGIRYDYTNLFCSTCATKLKVFMTGSPKL